MAVALDFAGWLGNKLKDLNTDENVFGSYIIGILDGDETADEKNEALQGLLSEILENADNLNDLCLEIFSMWSKFKEKEEPKHKPLEDVDVKLAKLLESQSLPTNKQKQYTAEEMKIREAILSQYSQMSDEEDEEASQSTTENGLERNTNAATIAQAEKEKRETARVESQKKKEKDKEDREKQKQLKEEKKEKRKTVKGERRR